MTLSRKAVIIEAETRQIDQTFAQSICCSDDLYINRPIVCRNDHKLGEISILPQRPVSEGVCRNGLLVNSNDPHLNFTTSRKEATLRENIASHDSIS